LLLTGFEPFDGSSVNPSEQVVRALAHEKLPRIQLRTAILPVPLKTMAGLAHLPPLPEQAAARERLIPSMSLDTILAGIRAAIAAIETHHRKNKSE